MGIRAAVMVEPRASIALWEIDDPVVEEGGILLETVASEVCGTDVHLHHGRLDGVPYPIIPGHVSVGRILEARGVDRDALGEALHPGDVVTFYDVHEVCNACYHCTVANQPNRCPKRRVYGITYSAQDGPLGGWAERIYLRPGVRVLKLPERLTADDVIGGGCGLFTGFAAVERSDLCMGDTVVVQGAGPVGLAAAAFAQLRGAGAVVVIGAPATRLSLARELGADLVLSLEEHPLDARADAVRGVTQGRGADVIIEASGNPAAISEGLNLLRDGGTYVVGGHYTDTGTVQINPHTHINRRHADILGQWGTDFRHIVRALHMLARHREKLPFHKVIGARYGLDEADRALDDVANLRVTKAIIDPKL
ncbi:MAG: zinc-binding dehydrogenase [Gemmatimonadota bacterium]|nr:MAG: zinc-binding dehydrogenase [Gemmatimonadota bacterium]